jgi:aminoglycoside phosphotransferase (APT) family kinase protein
MIGIPESENFKKIKPLDKGLSGDKKYYIENADGRRLLLRINDIAQHDRKKTMFEMMKHAAVLGIPMPQPVAFGLCDDGKSVYQLLTWCDGEDAEAVLPKLSGAEQYVLGAKSGEILQKIHSISAPNYLEDWAIRYTEVNSDRIKAFNKCGIQIEGSDAILRYFEENEHLLNGRPQCFRHGDYHNGNFLISDKHDLFVIDWELLDYDNFGDPWEEFVRIGNSEVIPHFTTGQLRGYFGGEPPTEFWHLLALYLSAGALMLVTWAFYLQQDCLEYSVQNANNVLRWFDNMNNPIPTWYLKDYPAL